MQSGRTIAALGAAAVLALAGCGGSSGVSSGTYVRSICTTLGTWKNDVQAASSKLESSAPATSSLAQGKQEYVSFVGALRTATAQAAAGLKSAGVPSVSGGGQIASALVGAFSRANADLAAAANQASTIPITSAAAYQAAASGITLRIRQSLASMTAITPRNNPPLRDAASKEPTCQALASG